MGGVVVLRATNPSVSFMDGKEASWCRGGRVATNGPTNTQIKSPRAVDRPYERSGYRTSLARPRVLGSKASSFPHAAHPWGVRSVTPARVQISTYKKRITGSFHCSTSYWRIKRKNPGRAELVRVPNGRHRTNRKFPQHYPHPTPLYISGITGLVPIM